MTPKRIGFVGFDGVTASHLVGPADAFSAAALDDGYSNRIPCYQIHVIGLSSACCRAESGMIFTPEETLEAVSEWDTIVVPGGKGLRKPEVCEKIADWVLMNANQTRRMNGTTISWDAERDRRRSTVCGWQLRERLRRVAGRDQRPVLVRRNQEEILAFSLSWVLKRQRF